MDTHDINVIESGLYNYYNYDLTTRRSVLPAKFHHKQ